MIREIQGVQNRHEGRMEENEMRATQVIESEARGASRDQRNHMSHENRVLLLVGEREKEFVKTQMHS